MNYSYRNPVFPCGWVKENAHVGVVKVLETFGLRRTSRNTSILYLSRCLLILFSIVFASVAHAHGGGLDSNGGHVDKTTGEYHCHKTDCVLPVVNGKPANEILVASFNIHFLGNSPSRDNTALAALLKQFDIVVVQELVSPPFDGSFPDGKPYRPDAESAAFFTAMEAQGFDFVLSPEDTGTGDKIHKNGSSTEWWVTFFNPLKVQPDQDLPNGFLAGDRSNNSDYERVPYAFGFTTESGHLDFVLISVHLQPGSGSSDAARRSHEIESIVDWIDDHDNDERDFIVLGDMNIENCAELNSVLPTGYASLNDTCLATNTNSHSPHPYDQVLYRPSDTTAIELPRSLKVINLIETMSVSWHMNHTGPYPGDPYDHNTFKAVYSDHNPIAFRLIAGETDDD